jgi:hypothetical protein
MTADSQTMPETSKERALQTNLNFPRRSNLIQLFPIALAAAVSACSGGETQLRPDDPGQPSGGSSGRNAVGGSAGDIGEEGGAPSNSGGIQGTGAVSVNPGMGGRGGSAGGSGGKSCGTTELKAEPPIANVLLVIDKSSSMENQGGFAKSKWLTLKEALADALDATRSRVSYGLDFYPFSQEPGSVPDTCETPESGGPLVPIAGGQDSVEEILDSLAAHEPAGGTPTAAALARAGEYFASGDGAALEGEKYVLLATDGGPNCNPDLTCDASSCTINMEGLDCAGNCCDPAKDPSGPTSCLDESGTLEAVTALADAGVKTFVVGIPGSQFYAETLDRVAVAGLVPNGTGDSKYYRVSADGDAEGLTDVLTRITTSVITTCRLQLASDPPALDRINVEIDGAPVAQSGDDGWEIDEATSPPTLVLRGETCRLMETEGAGSITVTFGCPTVITIF